LSFGEKRVLRGDTSPVPVITHMANKIKPPNVINIPVGKRIARCVPTSRIGLENNEPIVVLSLNEIVL
jgi:hypothetical protein